MLDHVPRRVIAAAALVAAACAGPAASPTEPLPPLAWRSRGSGGRGRASGSQRGPGRGGLSLWRRN